MVNPWFIYCYKMLMKLKGIIFEWVLFHCRKRKGRILHSLTLQNKTLCKSSNLFICSENVKTTIRTRLKLPATPSKGLHSKHISVVWWHQRHLYAKPKTFRTTLVGRWREASASPPSSHTPGVYITAKFLSPEPDINDSIFLSRKLLSKHNILFVTSSRYGAA